jgi:hypothetical protein
MLEFWQQQQQPFDLCGVTGMTDDGRATFSLSILNVFV